jgi:hypothetical protein
MTITKDEAIRLYGSGRQLALALGIKPAAVYQWGDTIPLARYLDLRYRLKPEAFDADGALINPQQETGPKRDS